MDADGYQQGQQQPRQCQLPTSPTALHVDITNDGNDDDSSSSNNKNSILDHIEDVKNTIKNKKSNSNSNSNSSIISFWLNSSNSCSSSSSCCCSSSTNKNKLLVCLRAQGSYSRSSSS